VDKPIGKFGIEVLKYYWVYRTTRLSELDKYVFWGVNTFQGFGIAITTQLPDIILGSFWIGISILKILKEDPMFIFFAASLVFGYHF